MISFATGADMLLALIVGRLLAFSATSNKGRALFLGEARLKFCGPGEGLQVGGLDFLLFE